VNATHNTRNHTDEHDTNHTHGLRVPCSACPGCCVDHASDTSHLLLHSFCAALAVPDALPTAVQLVCEDACILMSVLAVRASTMQTLPSKVRSFIHV
jgi:hypothetical protein